jgi:glycosyltransferase involved in cell wall biosynthesis
MINNKTIAVVVPCYNEETQILTVLKSMPSFVDRIVVINDCSKDNTEQKVLEYIDSDKSVSTILNKNTLDNFVKTIYNEAEYIAIMKDEENIKNYVESKIFNEDGTKGRVVLISLLKNKGVGSAIKRGYKWCSDYNVDCTAVMAGDGQMDPDELISICEPIINEDVDYVKGNRLSHRVAKYVIPRHRFLGNSLLSILTKIATGYWRVSDTQTGYTAISLKSLKSIHIHKIFDSYGMPNDMLVKLNIINATIKEVPIKPIYRVGEQSKMKIYKVIFTISLLLFKSFFIRIFQKYTLKNFHPLSLLYYFSIIMLIPVIYYFNKISSTAFTFGGVPENYLIKFFIFTFFMSLSILFAMWMDMQDNERLNK